MITDSAISHFLVESLGIEGIHREPTEDEMSATKHFLRYDHLSFGDVAALQEVYAPGKPIRDKIGMNVRVGRYHPPLGGFNVVKSLVSIVDDANKRNDPWTIHIAFEGLHPFMDGNGRTGRALWAWNMLTTGEDPFSLSFLHRFYYQTLAAVGR